MSEGGTADHERLAAERLSRLDEANQRSVWRVRRLELAVGSVLLAGIVGLATADGVGVVELVGVDTATATASADGVTLAVRHPTVTRPALASPFEIVVTQEGGFGGGSVEVAVAVDYLTLWDLNGLYPQPDSETADGDRVLWTFEPPDGEQLRVVVDARIEPAAQDGERGRVAVLDEQGGEQVVVDIETRVRP
jgi:hypothetical protein